MSPLNNETPDAKPLSIGFYVRHMMRYGFVLGLFMSLQFLSLLLYDFGIIAQLIHVGMFLAIPVLIVVLARHFRRNVRGDVMSYLEAVGFLLGTYLFAMIINFLAYYVGFSILLADPEWMGLMEQFVDLWIRQSPQATSEEIDIVRSILYMTPKQLAKQLATTAMFLGFVYIYIVAFFVKKTR